MPIFLNNMAHCFPIGWMQTATSRNRIVPKYLYEYVVCSQIDTNIIWYSYVSHFVHLSLVDLQYAAIFYKFILVTILPHFMFNHTALNFILVRAIASSLQICAMRYCMCHTILKCTIFNMRREQIWLEFLYTHFEKKKIWAY